MTTTNLLRAFVGAALVAFLVWIGSNTYWVDVQVPMPPQGEARTNPFYAAQRFAEALGARTTWDRVLTTLPTDSVIVLSGWHWSLSVSRRESLERWVEAGGRLVVDETLAGDPEYFERWSGIVTDYREWDETSEDTLTEQKQCRQHDEEPTEASAMDVMPSSYSLCDVDGLSFLASNRPMLWALGNQAGIQAMRVQVGQGRVTVINATPFRERALFDGDHGRLFVAATEIRRGDEIHFLSEDDHPSLLALLWQNGGPVVMLALALVGLVLWRRGTRFGPLEAPPDRSRRSLAEQIRGTGQFALRHGSGDALHAASVRALDEAAGRRIHRYAQLTAKERATALARLTGMGWKTLATAVHHGDVRGSSTRHESTSVPTSAIAVLETARRQLLITPTGPSHATD